jgi:sugar lactone lactonase YvrE
MWVAAVWAAVWIGCAGDPDPTEPTDGPSDGTPVGDSGSTPGTGTTGATGATGDTAGSTEPFDCSAIPSAPFNVWTYEIETTEDFDFDALGSLVFSDWVNLVAVDSYGVFSVISPGIEDTRGIQVLSDGNVAAAYITQGRVGFTDRLTGSSVTLLSGLSGPNALEIADDDIMYVSETGWFGGGSNTPRVVSFDPATGATTVVANGFDYPNGLALNDAQDTLYVADNTSGLYRVRKDGAGGWLPKELLFDPPGTEAYDGIEVDICGNVYLVQFYNGALHRFDPETLQGELLVDLDDSQQFLWNAIRWGSGRGIWRRDVLYVTDRNKVFAVEVGVPGRRQPVDAMP